MINENPKDSGDTVQETDNQYVQQPEEVSRNPRHIYMLVVIVLMFGAVLAMAVVGFISKDATTSTTQRDTPLQVEKPTQTVFEGKTLSELNALSYSEDRASCTDRNPLRNLYFGDLHIHTSYSMDAYAWDAENDPYDSYVNAKSNGLDFAAVSDHSEHLGEIVICTTPGVTGYESAACERFRNEKLPNAQRLAAFPGQNRTANPSRQSSVCGPDNERCLKYENELWTNIIDAAQTHYDTSDSCNFTTFVGYEYAHKHDGNLDRNIIFRNLDVPDRPITHHEAPEPELLHKELHDQCLDSDNDCDVIAIPHNANAGNGDMFKVIARDEVDECEALTFRHQLEPIVEVFQHKGQGECIAGYVDSEGNVDAYCDFEPGPADGDIFDGYHEEDFMRGALGSGLEIQTETGINPFEFGVIGSTDGHNGDPNVEESTYRGNIGNRDTTPINRVGSHFHSNANPGGLAAVWAIENSRDALFDALKRREVYGTSGSKIKLRFFGGYGFDQSIINSKDTLLEAYSDGVPMGSTLTHNENEPTFYITAEADSVPLNRLQIIKGWLEDDELKTRVMDVLESESHTTLDTNTCTISGSGSDILETVWTDPDFDPEVPAYYYVRVLEEPSCRWSTYDCNSLSSPEKRRAVGCTDAVPDTIQERAWSSPIWYLPEEYQNTCN